MKTPHITYGDDEKVFDAIAAAIDVADNDYENGIENIAIAFLYRKKAKECGCAFIDPHYVNGNQAALFSELREQPSETIMTAPIQIYADDAPAPGEAYRQLFKNTVSVLQNSNNAPDTVIMPVGCQENGATPHNILVVLEDFNSYHPKASIIDQIGANYYIDTKIKINDTLNELGIFDTETNEYPIMSCNRHDCATFTSFMADYAFEKNHCDMHEFIALSDAQEGRCVTTDAVDTQHRKDKELLLKAGQKFSAEIKQQNTVNRIVNKTVAELRNLKTGGGRR